MSASDSRSSGVLNTLLIVSALTYSSMHLRVALKERATVERESVAAAQALSNVKKLQVQADTAIAERDEQLKLAGQKETQYAALLTDLLELAKVDPDARLIVSKWKIQQQGAAQGAGAQESPGAADTKQAPVARPKPAAPSSSPLPLKP